MAAGPAPSFALHLAELARRSDFHVMGIRSGSGRPHFLLMHGRAGEPPAVNGHPSAIVCHAGPRPWPPSVCATRMSTPPSLRRPFWCLPRRRPKLMGESRQGEEPQGDLAVSSGGAAPGTLIWLFVCALFTFLSFKKELKSLLI